MNIRKSSLGVLMLGMVLGQGGAACAEGQMWYIGAGVGQSTVDISAGDVDALWAAEGLTTSSSVDDNDTAWKLFGGYRINDNFGVEAAYMDYGTITADSVVTAPAAATIGIDADTTAWIVDVVGTLPLSEQFGVFGKLGVAAWEIDSSASVVVGATAASINADEDGSDFHFGVGASYSLMDNVAVRAEWERINGDDDLDAWTLGAQMSF